MSNVIDPGAGRFGTAGSRGQPPQEGIGPLLGDLLKDLQRMVRGEIALARAEVRDDVSQAGKGVASMAIAAIVGLTGFLLLMLAVAYVLNLWMRMWIAMGIVAVVLLAVAGMLAMNAKAKLSATNLKPEQTIESMKENEEWAKQQINSVKR